MVVFSPFVLLLCTLWELCARLLIYFLLFTDKKKKKRLMLKMIIYLRNIYFINYEDDILTSS